MLTKSYKDYLREQDLLHQIKEGDYLHIITEDGVETIRLGENPLIGSAVATGAAGLAKVLKIPLSAAKKLWKKHKGKLGFVGGAGLGGLLGGGGEIQSLFKQGYDLASNQFVGKNPITESLNKSVTEKFTDDVAHFVLDLR
jgi:hypothetical protein